MAFCRELALPTLFAKRKRGTKVYQSFSAQVAMYLDLAVIKLLKCYLNSA